MMKRTMKCIWPATKSYPRREMHRLLKNRTRVTLPAVTISPDEQLQDKAELHAFLHWARREPGKDAL
jgi:hypothetical protein